MCVHIFSGVILGLGASTPGTARVLAGKFSALMAHSQCREAIVICVYCYVLLPAHFIFNHVTVSFNLIHSFQIGWLPNNPNASYSSTHAGGRVGAAPLPKTVPEERRLRAGQMQPTVQAKQYEHEENEIKVLSKYDCRLLMFFILK